LRKNVDSKDIFRKILILFNPLLVIEHQNSW